MKQRSTSGLARPTSISLTPAHHRLLEAWQVYLSAKNGMHVSRSHAVWWLMVNFPVPAEDTASAALIQERRDELVASTKPVLP